MDMEFTEEQKMLQKQVRDFAKNEVAPKVAIDDKEHRFQRDLVTKMGELGLFGCPIPEEYGGNGMGFLAHAIVCEEIGRVSGSLRVAFNMQTMGPAKAILDHGSEELKRKYIPKLMKAEFLGCFGITEPEAGSDAASMSTTAVLDGDHWVVSGSKTWITWATVADMGIFFLYTDRSQKYKGMSCLIIDLNSPGVTKLSLADKMGLHACPTGQLFFENVRVPKGNILGKPGEGWGILMQDLNNTRLTTAAGAVGASQAALDEAINYAKQRKQFGQEIGQFQMVQDSIARMVVETEAARWLTYRAAARRDQGITNTLDASMAKFKAAEVASLTADLGLLVLGAYGYSTDYPMERLVRDNKLYQIIEGSANIQKTIISTIALGYRKA
jgi:glutaryl-CoA dehydrogenase (non-decarboxylating)